MLEANNFPPTLMKTKLHFRLIPSETRLMSKWQHWPKASHAIATSAANWNLCFRSVKIFGTKRAQEVFCPGWWESWHHNIKDSEGQREVRGRRIQLIPNLRSWLSTCLLCRNTHTNKFHARAFLYLSSCRCDTLARSLAPHTSHNEMLLDSIFSCAGETQGLSAAARLFNNKKDARLQQT